MNPRLRVEVGRQADFEYEIPPTAEEEAVWLGRGAFCKIRITDMQLSRRHCQFTFEDAQLFVEDLNSRNGVKVNNMRVTEKRVDPGDTLIIARHTYEMQYSPAELGAVGPPPIEDLSSDIFNRSLLERAGLSRGDEDDEPASRERAKQPSRYDVLDDGEGQIRDPNAPI